jgi:hypothetical protein
MGPAPIVMIVRRRQESAPGQVPRRDREYDARIQTQTFSSKIVTGPLYPATMSLDVSGHFSRLCCACSYLSWTSSTLSQYALIASARRFSKSFLIKTPTLKSPPRREKGPRPVDYQNW